MSIAASTTTVEQQHPTPAAPTALSSGFGSRWVFLIRIVYRAFRYRLARGLEFARRLLSAHHPLVTFTQGDIFESSAQTITNTVNCVGVMGKGLALEFKRRYPTMYEDYVARCETGEVLPGQPYLYRAESHWILNFPTKRHWRAPSQLADIEEGLRFLRDHASAWGITSLALPPLGCGEGGLKWETVRPMMLQHMSDLGIPVEIYEPKSHPA